MSPTWLVLVALAFSAANTACASAKHASIARAPTRDASAASREQFYKDHRPLGLGGLSYASAWTPSQSFLTLADGTLVKEPNDLVANVAPDSVTARAAARSQESVDEAELWTRVSGVVLGLGFATMGASLLPAVIFPLPEDPDQRVSATTLGPPLAILAAGTLIALGGTIPLFFAQNAAVDAEEQKQTAFISYDASLRAHMGLTPFTSPEAIASNGRMDRAPPDPLD